MELIAAEPALSKGVNKYGQSPMFIAAMRNFTGILEELLKIPDFSHAGRKGRNALHAVAENGDQGELYGVSTNYNSSYVLHFLTSAY